jgi:SagB-type dehydrogenase family enzyme
LYLAIERRKTQRSFRDDPLELAQLSHLLWAAHRIPSAGALRGLMTHLVTVHGVYAYRVDEHSLIHLSGQDVRHKLATACVHQEWLADAPVSLVLAVDIEPYRAKYGRRGIRYAYIESGHAAQNVFLMADTLDLGAGIVGAFSDARVTELALLPGGVSPVLVMPIGRKEETC